MDFSGINLRTELLSYNGLLIPFLSNIFFHPNLCHVCKSANNGRLHLCNKCRMISYCSRRHKMMHRAEHSMICSVIKKLLKENLLRMCRLTSTECVQLKDKIFKLVSEKVHRSLQEYEKEMFYYAKTCYICHRWFDLNTCTVCFSANFCSDHSQDFYNYHHTSKCKDLLTYLNYKINILNIVSARRNPSFCFRMRSDIVKCASDIFDFFKLLYTHARNESSRAEPWTTDCLVFSDYLYSECISLLLTLYYGMQDANLIHFLSKPVCVIHIIFPYNIPEIQLHFWEILFDLLDHEVRKIIIIFLFATDFTNVRDEFTQRKICATCGSHQRILTFQFYSLCYENYVFCTEYRRPNVIISFNVNKLTNWTRACLTALQDQDCPLFLTFIGLKQTRSLVNYIENILGVAQPIIRKNRFRSLLPVMDFSSADDVFYRNQYFVIYEKLKNSNEPIPGISRT